MKEAIVIGKRASSNVFIKMATYLDLEKKVFKLSERTFGIPSGIWKPIPKLDYILVFKTLYIKCEGCSPEDFDNDKGSIYQLSLVYNKNRKIIVHETNLKNEIFTLAEKLSSFFKIKIRDSASDRRNPKWL